MEYNISWAFLNDPLLIDVYSLPFGWTRYHNIFQHVNSYFQFVRILFLRYFVVSRTKGSHEYIIILYQLHIYKLTKRRIIHSFHNDSVFDLLNRMKIIYEMKYTTKLKDGGKIPYWTKMSQPSKITREIMIETWFQTPSQPNPSYTIIHEKNLSKQTQIFIILEKNCFLEKMWFYMTPLLQIYLHPQRSSQR